MKKLLLYFLQNLHFIFYADTHRPTTQVSSSILSHSIYRDKIQSTFSLLPYPNDPYSFFFLLLCLPSSFCPLLSLSLSLSISRSTRSLFVIHRVRSAYLRVHPSGFQIFGYSRCSLTIPYLSVTVVTGI